MNATYFRLVRRTAWTTALAAVVTFTSAPANAQVVQPNAPDGYRNARRLGGSTSFHQPPLTTVASLTKKLYQTLDVHNAAELGTKIWLSEQRNEDFSYHSQSAQ